MSKPSRPILIGLVTLVSLAAALFVGLRLVEGIRLQTTVVTLEARIEALEAASARHDETDGRRLEVMEAFVFGPVAAATVAPDKLPPAKTVVKLVPPEAWMVNRDKVLRERLRRLEEWRLSLMRDEEE